MWHYMSQADSLDSWENSASNGIKYPNTPKQQIVHYYSKRLSSYRPIGLYFSQCFVFFVFLFVTTRALCYLVAKLRLLF